MAVTFTDLDLSTATLEGGTATYDGTGITGATTSDYPDFRFPDFLDLDPTKWYRISIDVAAYDNSPGTGTTPTVWLYSQNDSLGDPYADSDWWGLGTAAGESTGSAATITCDIGPGLNAWDAAVADGESGILFEGDRHGLEIIAVRWAEISAPNDNIFDALVIPVATIAGGGSWASPGEDITLTTIETESSEPSPSFGSGDQSVWYYMNNHGGTQVSGTITFDTTDSTSLGGSGTPDTIIELFTVTGTYYNVPEDIFTTMAHVADNDDDADLPSYGDPGWTGTSKMVVDCSTLGNRWFYIRVMPYNADDSINVVMTVGRSSTPPPGAGSQWVVGSV